MEDDSSNPFDTLREIAARGPTPEDQPQIAALFITVAELFLMTQIRIAAAIEHQNVLIAGDLQTEGDLQPEQEPH
jgi:hypothetical protein